MEGITKTFTLTGTKGATARVTVQEDYSLDANTSTLTVAVELSLSTYFGHTYYLKGSVSAAGQSLQRMDSSDGTHYVTLGELDTYYPIRTDSENHTGSPWVTAAITHNTDGSKSVTVSLDITGYERFGKGANGFTVSGSREIQLTHIPRESAIGATDAAIESASSVSVTRKSTAYKHSVAYRFGSLSGYLTASGGISSTEMKFTASSIPFAIPAAFYGEIPDSKTGICTLTCRTYSGSTQIGSATTCQFTVTAQEDRCGPAVSATVADTNAATVALTGDKNVLVRYASTALCTISATARCGATIATKKIGATVVSGNTKTIQKTEWSGYSFTATDSRGYSKKISVKKELIPYVTLSCVASGQRTDPTSGNAQLTIKGAYFAGSFGAASNTLTLRYRKGSGSWVSVSPAVKDNAYTATVALTGLDYTQSFTFTVEASDRLATITKTVRIEKGIPVFDWGEADFQFHVPVHCLAGGTVSLSGLKGDRVEDEQELESLLETAYSAMNGATTRLVYWTGYPSATSHGWFGILSKSSQNNGSIKAWSANLTGSLVFKVKFSGAWQPLQWQNPPMEVGTEYRTVERYQGKPVYCKTISIGVLPSNAKSTTPHGIVNSKNFVALWGHSGRYYFPTQWNADAIGTINIYATSTNVFVRTTDTWDNYAAYVTIRYTKSTD